MWNSLFGVADADQPQQSETRDDHPATTHTGGATGTTSDDAFSEPECDYDTNPTQLYKLIENKAWDAAICRVQVVGLVWRRVQGKGRFDGDCCRSTPRACSRVH